MPKCINCGKETEYDWCSEECRVCQRCGRKLDPTDDIYCILCSTGIID